MNKEQIKNIEKRYKSLNEKKFPASPPESESDYASIFADLVFIDTNLAGLFDSLFSSAFNEEKKRLFIEYRTDLKKVLETLKSRKKDEIIGYFSELLEVAEMIEKYIVK